MVNKIIVSFILIFLHIKIRRISSMYLNFCNILSKFYKNFRRSTMKCLRQCLRIQSFKSCVCKFSSSSPCSLSARRRLVAECANENHSQTVESHRRPRSVLLGYASASDGRFAWPTDRPTDRLYCCSSRCLSFLPACFVRYTSSSRLSRRTSHDVRYVMSQVSTSEGSISALIRDTALAWGERRDGRRTLLLSSHQTPRSIISPGKKVLGSLRSH